MKLVSVTVKNFRSYVVGQNDTPPTLAVGEGLNLLVGPNNCGKSNLLRAVALALEKHPAEAFNPQTDIPAQLTWAYPTITLHFRCSRRQSVEDTLLKYAQAYEDSTQSATISSYAANDQVRLRVSFSKSAAPNVVLLARGAGNRQGDAELLEKALTQFRKCVRFVYLKSGESLTKFLGGAFRELLHTVLRDHLKDHFTQAEARREEYVLGLVEELLQPLQTHAFDELRDVMAEITSLSIVPHVPTVAETLAKADIMVSDAADTALVNKGTGVRGALLVALLGYLAKNSRRSLVFAVEEPESFLHPRAQQELRRDLSDLAKRDDVTLLVTSHSPFMLDRSPSTILTPIRKDAQGRTSFGEQVRGNQSHVDAVADLFGETITPIALEAVEPIRTDARAVLLTEGYSDKFYMERAVEVASRTDLLDGLEIRHGDGAHKAAMHALFLAQMTQNSVPIGVVFDSDPYGKSACQLLKKKFNWKGGRVVTYLQWKDNVAGDVPVEAEDMFPEEFLLAFLQAAGDEVLAEKQRFNETSFHYGFTQVGKGRFLEFVQDHLKPSHTEKWLELIQTMRIKLGLG